MPPTETAAAAPKKASRAGKSGAKKTAAKKKSTTGGRKKAPSKARAAQSDEIPEPSDADIRLRAYFIAERRVQQALQGDPNNDWLEAKQQLMDEARQARS